jgi:hypothetical protein
MVAIAERQEKICANCQFRVAYPERRILFNLLCQYSIFLVKLSIGSEVEILEIILKNNLLVLKRLIKFFINRIKCK